MKTRVRTRVILVTALIALLALPVAVYAQETDPVTVTEGHVEAVNNGDVAAAGEVMAEEAVVTVPQATSGEEETEAVGEAEPEAEAEYTGSAEYQAWLDAQAAANAETTLGECTVAGEVVTCDVSYTSDALQAMGVGAVEGVLEVTVVEGQIQAYAFTLSAESVAMLQAEAAPEVMPVTGGTKQNTTNLVLLAAVLGLLLLAVGAFVFAVTRAFQPGV
jgi:hypothetical protein